MPDFLIALDFDVAAHEEAGVPGIFGAGDGVRAVVEKKIAEDRGARGVGGDDFLLAADEALVLIKIRGVADVVGDGLVVAAGFGNAVDLDGEHDGNAFGLELAREGDHGARAPAVAVQNDVGGALLFCGERRGGFCAEQTHDESVRVVRAAIFECLRRG